MAARYRLWDKAFRPTFGAPKTGGTRCSMERVSAKFSFHLSPLERLFPSRETQNYNFFGQQYPSLIPLFTFPSLPSNLLSAGLVSNPASSSAPPLATMNKKKLKGQSPRNPLRDLNAITVHSSNNGSDALSSISVEAPQGCLRFSLSSFFFL
ncbi:hypothetical protein DVH24_011870 [Malus domestica]|uniref:Uncharacterized protein n=1 Tax=Malus domestica TaxID=3750 RepID=A0A498JCH8_MALDO|nr:hypothetical protein DVH24_011870 [Malus domestica]